MKILVPDYVKRDIIKSSSLHQLRRGIELVQSSKAPYALKTEMVENLEEQMIVIALGQFLDTQNQTNN